jgi:tagatose 1,6-diphosphate aldolase
VPTIPAREEVITAGKRRGLEAVSTRSGIIAAAAMDQRGSLEKSLAAAKGVDRSQITPDMMAEFKAAVARILTPRASAILLDPDFGLRASRERAPNAGLLLAYEKSGYDNSQPGRLPDLLPHASVRRLVEWGADAVKVLLYYTPFEKPEINDAKHAFVERIGGECAAADVPFFLEFVGYDPAGADEKGFEYALRKPEIVTGSMREFTQSRYGVDVLKVEFPVNLEYVEGSAVFRGRRACSREEALGHFRRAASVASRPFIYLSAGVSNAQFTESLRMAAEAGVDFSGVLCGRATWKDGIPVYAKQGSAAFERWLAREGIRNIEAVNEALAPATPWTRKLGIE